MRIFDLGKEVPRIGERAEIIASWYLRFNGYFPLKGFILHDAGVTKQPGGQLTDADILAVRLPYTQELIEAPDGKILVRTDPDLDIRQGEMDFVISEVSSETCKFNWINQSDNRVNGRFLEYTLRRFGFWTSEVLSQITNELSDRKRFSSDIPMPVRIRLLSLGVRESLALPSEIRQITFERVFKFLDNLFGCYEPDSHKPRSMVVSDHKQWHPLICEIYARVRGHRVRKMLPVDIVAWLFPDSGKA